MAVTLQRSGVGSLAYPLYLVDYASDVLPTSADDDATLFVLETRQTLVWRGGLWRPFDDRSAALSLRQAVEAAPQRPLLLILRELRRVGVLLALSQGIPSAAFEPLPELDNL